MIPMLNKHPNNNEPNAVVYVVYMQRTVNVAQNFIYLQSTGSNCLPHDLNAQKHNTTRFHALNKQMFALLSFVLVFCYSFCSNAHLLSITNLRCLE